MTALRIAFGRGGLRLRIVPVLMGDGRSFTPTALGERSLCLERVHAHPPGHIGVTYDLR